MSIGESLLDGSKLIFNTLSCFFTGAGRHVCLLMNKDLVAGGKENIPWRGSRYDDFLGGGRDVMTWGRGSGYHNLTSSLPPNLRWRRLVQGCISWWWHGCVIIVI